MGFQIAAMRFVLAGGSYAPVDCLLATPPQAPASETLRGQPSPPSLENSEPLCDLTPRERKVVKAIQCGKSNKVIAYELNMWESTVKVHVRNVMKKWKAKPDVAIRAQNAIGAGAYACSLANNGVLKGTHPTRDRSPRDISQVETRCARRADILDRERAAP
jgi:DNA-binding NarL/FixJ family response regulator